jgi:glycerate-2-kinase
VEDSRNIVVASADSDGTDGPTDVAGGLVDGYTMERTRKAELNVFDELGNHNSHEVLARLGDTIITGALSTNVRGLGVVYVAGMSGPLRQ